MSKGTILCTALLLSGTMAFADNAGSNNTNNDTTTPAENSTTSTTPSTDTSTPSTDTNSTTTTPSTDTNSTTTTPSTDTNSTTTTPSTDTNSTTTTPSTDSTTSTTAPSTNGQGTQSGTGASTNVNETTNAANIDVDSNLEVVNNKVNIHGVTTAPTFTTVEFRDNVYYIPETITPVGGFYFLKIDSTERVCSLKKVEKVKVLSTPTTTTVMIGPKKHVLYCYDRSYFNF